MEENNTLMENNFASKQNNEYLLLDEAVEYLNQTRKWTKFLAILGFIGIGFIVVAGIFVMLMGSTISQLAQSPIPFNIGYLGAIYLVIGAVYFIPIYYLYTFSNKMKRALYGNDLNTLTLSFRYLRNYYRFLGIFAIVIISLYILIFVGMLIGVGASGLYNL